MSRYEGMNAYERKKARSSRREAELKRLGGQNNDRGEQRTEEVVIAQDTAKERENPEATTEVCDNRDLRRNFRYPLEGVDTAPARIIFAVHKIKPLFDLSNKIKINKKERADEVKGAGARTREGIVDTVGEVVEGTIETTSELFQSYDNTNANNEFGRVTLPLYKALPFRDNVSYNTADLGILANAGNLSAISDDQGRLSGAAKAVALNAVARPGTTATGAALGAGVEKFFRGKAGVGTAITGFLADQAGQQIGAASRNATRVATAPNERTLFEKVNLRTHQFSFKMIARNSVEQREIKNIVQFFREEVYPEAITVVEGGPPFAYEFPNVFQIEVLNQSGYTPAFKFERCYLESVETTFNATASGLYNAEEFVEVDISLTFRGITALHKGLVRDEGF